MDWYELLGSELQSAVLTAADDNFLKAWKRDDALQVVDTVVAADFRISGGDVWLFVDGVPIVTYENWSCRSSFTIEECAAHSRAYISAFAANAIVFENARQASNGRFSLEEIEAGTFGFAIVTSPK